MADFSILLVDDDDELRNSVELFLKNKNYDVTTAIDGKSALDKFNSGNFRVVLSDIRMPEMDGTELLNAIKGKSPDVYFILMTGFAEILATIDAFELGADNFLSKPFKLNELENILRGIEKKGEAPGKAEESEAPQNTQCGPDGCIAVESEGEVYKSIEIEKFVHGSKINFPIYIRLGEKKFVKLAHKGEDISRENISKFKDKQITHLYLLEEDFKQYIKMTISIANAMTGSAVRIPREKKLKFLSDASEIIMKDIFCSAIEAKDFDDAHGLLKKTLDLASDNNTLFKVCESIITHSDKLYAHSLFVSMFAIMLSRKLNWVSGKNLDLLSMGALFHDIGKRTLPQEIVDKRLIDLDYDERQLIETHPTTGSEMLMELPDISDVVIQICLQHHENNTGTGYPSRLKSKSILPLAKIVSIANEFAITLDITPEQKKLETKYYMALKKMKSLKANQFEKEFFERFISLFHFDDV
ncbi:MAG: response regulator [Oligoflexia bacterium]|nr:response regulator [Oligoflexia bacterium]